MTLKLQDMDKGIVTVFERRFLVDGLPAGHVPSEPHLQIFDNYLQNTGLRLRKTRNPETDEWRFFIQKGLVTKGDDRRRRFSRIELSGEEYKLFAGLLGRETRKNRYVFDESGLTYRIDIFLGRLFGLNIAIFTTEESSEIETMTLPSTAVTEVSGDKFFEGNNLADLDFDTVRSYVRKKKEVR